MDVARALRESGVKAVLARAIEAVYRIESSRLIAGLARYVRDVGLAKELAQRYHLLRAVRGTCCRSWGAWMKPGRSSSGRRQ
ncbi:hypothetical protein BH23ACT12_BH23ACT12_12980 [soil metagenome]